MALLDAGRGIPQPARVQTGKNPTASLLPLVITLFALIVAFHLGNALSGQFLFRAPHLGTALEYAGGPINLFKPVIVGFNATDTPTALEFPLWQAAVGLVFKITGSTWYGWANLVSLIFFATWLWPFFKLSRQYVAERTAWWATAFLLAQPVIIVWSGVASTDGFCLAVTIWFLFFADKMIRTGKARWWLPTVAFAIIAAVSKAPFFMAVGLCSVFLLLLNGVRDWRKWVMLVSVGVMAVIVFFAWTRYADSLLAQAEYPYVDMRMLQGPHQAGAYLGGLQYRMGIGHWIKGAWRFLHATLGTLPFALLLVTALLRPGNRFSKLWLAATFLTILVFSQAVLENWHYFLMCSPAVALLCGDTIARWEIFLTQEIPRAWLRISLAGLVLIFSAIDGVIATKVAVFYDSFPREMAAIIRAHTEPGDKLIVYCAGAHQWSGEELFGSGRKGLFVSLLEKEPGISSSKSLSDLLADETDMSRLKSLGFNKLVLTSESPVQFAVQAANPGSRRKRSYYPETISPVVDAWPVVYRSEDIIIKEIPK